MSTTLDLLKKNCVNYPTHICITTEKTSVSNAMLYENVLKTSSFFKKIGINEDDKVLIIGGNTINFIIAFFAIQAIGGIPVLANAECKSSELEYIVKTGNIKTVISDRNYKKNNLMENVKTLMNRYSFTLIEMSKLDKIISSEIKHSNITYSSDKDSVFCIQFTSGTTGVPKGVVLTQTAVIKNGQHTGDALHLEMHDTLCFAVPLFHCFGNVLALMSCLTHNTKMVLIDYYSPMKTLEAINKYNCSVFFGVPTMYIKIMQLNHLENRTLTISKLVVAGAVVNPTLMKSIKKEFNAKYVISGYGLTECSPGCTISDIYDDEILCHSTVGKKFPEIEIKIIDNNGNNVSDGVIGEIIVKGYNVSPGYYQNGMIVPITDSDGWLHTGDLGICENEYYKVLGRKDEMIIKGGENIAPIEIENYMLTIDYIIDIAVISIPDDVYGQEIVAGIIFKDNQVPETFLSDVSKKISHFKIPKYFVKFSNFPSSTSGKILKREMKEIVLDKIKRNEAIIYGV